MTNKIMNYEKHVNAFEYIEDVESHLVYDNDKVQNPFITIAILTYKRYDLIGEAIESAINQIPVDFEWDIIVVDNEAYDGEESETTKIIKSFNCDRIRHYRHSRTTRMFDNHNLAIKLARGEYVMLLHDDDILFANTLYKMGQAVKYLSMEKGKPLGVISATNHLFKYDPQNPDAHKNETENLKKQHMDKEIPCKFDKITHANILCTAHVGGSAPTCGSLFNRKIMLEEGGFDPEIGLASDLITLYKLENNCSVYRTGERYGLYRWGVNESLKEGVTYDALENYYLFREYIFNKNILLKIFGMMFRGVLYDYFAKDVLWMRSLATDKYINISDYDELYSKRANVFSKMIWKCFIRRSFRNIRKIQRKCRQKRIQKRIKQNDKK